jgi:hypothetical protein
MKTQDYLKKYWWVIAIIIALLLWKGQEITNGIPAITDNGVAMKAVIVDENGNVKFDLTGGKAGDTMSIISAPTPSGYIAISPYDCASGCSFLALQTKMNNAGGDSEVTVNDILGTVYCASGNGYAGCSSVPNTLGLISSTGNKRGNLDSKWDSSLPLTLAKGQASSTVITDGMALDEIAFGLMEFKVAVTGTFLDTESNIQPLTGKFGTMQLNIVPSYCSDNTFVDPNSADTDTSTYCSIVNKGKYCRVGSKGQPTLTDRASICGCATGYYAQGEVCKITSCTPNTCIAGSVNYCLTDGKSVEARCYQCGKSVSHLDYCGLDAYGSLAIDCNPNTAGIFSTCVYSAVGGQGFLVGFDPVTIPTIAECQDGIKSGTEQCDKNDFGGQSCSTIGSFSSGTLTCNADCTYNTAQCTSGWVKFRTTDLNYAASTGVAYSTLCNGNALTQYGKTSGACSTIYCDQTNPTLNVKSASGTTKMWVSGSDLCICDDGVISHTYAKRYTTADSDAGSVSNSATSIDSSKEMTC